MRRMQISGGSLLVECASSSDSLLVYGNKYYLQVYLESCAYQIVKTRMIHYLDGNLFESNEN